MSEPFHIEVIGIDEIGSEIRLLAREYPKKVAMSMRLEAEYIMTRSKQNFVPVDYGTLKSSGKVDPTVYDNGNFHVDLHFGDAASPYALAVHEHPSDHSPYSWRIAERNGNPVQFHPTGHGAKYLERPFNEALPGLIDRISTRVKLS